MSAFVKEESGGVMKIQCPNPLDAAAAKQFSEKVKDWVGDSPSNVVLDLNNVTILGREFYQALLQLKAQLKKHEKSVYTVGLSAQMLSQVTVDGVKQAFNPIKSISVLLNERPASSHLGFDVNLVNPFLSAVQKTLEVQCMTKVTPQKPFLKTSPVLDVAIAGVLSLNSDDFAGSIVICFSKEVFLKIYENMFAEKCTEITSEIEDAAGELLNIIYGTAKIELNSKGFNFQKALPTVLTGQKIVIRQTSVKPAVIVPFETETGLFYIEIEINQTLE